MKPLFRSKMTLAIVVELVVLILLAASCVGLEIKEALSDTIPTETETVMDTATEAEQIQTGETMPFEEPVSTEDTSPSEETDPPAKNEPEETDPSAKNEPEETDPSAKNEPEETDPSAETEPKETNPPAETEPKETDPPAETEPEEPEVPDLAIETPYVTLYYPGKWADSLKVESVELGFGMDVVFRGSIAGEEHWLFTVHFGGADGIAVGAVMAEEGYMLDVTIEMSDYVPDESWSKDDANMFSAMQEGMNHVMQKLMEDIAHSEETVPPAETEPEGTEAPDLTIETPYVTLYYPGKWADSLKVESVELDFGMDVVFRGVIAGKERWLFTVHFGGADGIAVGAVMAEEGYMLDVTIEMSDYVPDESWSEDDADMFSAMQESMNHVMQKLMEEPSFVS